MSALPLHATDRPPCIALLSRVLDMRYLVPAFQALRPDIAWRTADDLGDPADIDAAVCWLPPAGLLGAPNLRLIQSIGAGVDHIYADPAVPRHVPVCRVAEAGMAAGMSSYVAWAVINHHRHFPDYVRNHAQGVAREPHRAAVGTSRGHRRAGPAGPGRRARAGGAGLSRLGAARPSPTWPRASRAITAPTACRRCWQADTLVCLLPLTDETRGFLGAATFARLPRGPCGQRGPGRAPGPHRPAGGAGQRPALLRHAGRHPQEPLPPDHALWRHPKVMITPHIATRTPAAAIARQTLDNLAALRAGRRPDTCADAALGY